MCKVKWRERNIDVHFFTIDLFCFKYTENIEMWKLLKYIEISIIEIYLINYFIFEYSASMWFLDLRNCIFHIGQITNFPKNIFTILYTTNKYYYSITIVKLLHVTFSLFYTDNGTDRFLKSYTLLLDILRLCNSRMNLEIHQIFHATKISYVKGQYHQPRKIEEIERFLGEFEDSLLRHRAEWKERSWART